MNNVPTYETFYFTAKSVELGHLQKVVKDKEIDGYKINSTHTLRQESPSGDAEDVLVVIFEK